MVRPMRGAAQATGGGRGEPAALAVVIPTRNRPDLLVDCLRTLTRQTLPDIDVLVVDDGSERPLEPAVTGVDPRLRCHRQAPGGLNAARNAGVAHTTAPIVAFLDDDTLVAPGWAEAVVAAFAETGCSGLGGRVELDIPVDPPRWLTAKRRDYLAELELGPERRWLDGVALPVGANCAVRRDELDRTGGFRVGLDRDGASLISSGETEFFRRLRGAGGRLLYDPAAVVVHRVPAERVTVEWFHRRAYAQGASDAMLESLVTDASPALRRLRERVRAGRAAPILAKAIAQRRGTANARIWLSYCRGRRETAGGPRT
jgi:GT2 family glycosyltransferase